MRLSLVRRGGIVGAALVGAIGYINIGHMRCLKRMGESHCGFTCLLSLVSMSKRQFYLWLLEGSFIRGSRWFPCQKGSSICGFLKGALSVALVGANGYINIGHMRYMKRKGESHCGSRLCLLSLVLFRGVLSGHLV